MTSAVGRPLMTSSQKRVWASYSGGGSGPLSLPPTSPVATEGHPPLLRGCLSHGPSEAWTLLLNGSSNVLFNAGLCGRAFTLLGEGARHPQRFSQPHLVASRSTAFRERTQTLCLRTVGPEALEAIFCAVLESLLSIRDRGCPDPAGAVPVMKGNWLSLSDPLPSGHL